MPICPLFVRRKYPVLLKSNFLNAIFGDDLSNFKKGKKNFLPSQYFNLDFPWHRKSLSNVANSSRIVRECLCRLNILFGRFSVTLNCIAHKLARAGAVLLGLFDLGSLSDLETLGHCRNCVNLWLHNGPLCGLKWAFGMKLPNLT